MAPSAPVIISMVNPTLIGIPHLGYKWTRSNAGISIINPPQQIPPRNPNTICTSGNLIAIPRLVRKNPKVTRRCLNIAYSNRLWLGNSFPVIIWMIELRQGKKLIGTPSSNIIDMKNLERTIKMLSLSTIMIIVGILEPNDR